ncbi:LmeA family phospholipid-binding protein [Cellulosimicrobium sp. Marseille-Q8652]
MKRLVGVLVVLVVLVGVAVVVDRVALRSAESGAVTAFEQEADDVTGAQIDITGFPFLTQVARGELSHVTGSADSATFAGYAITDLQVDARGVGTSEPYTVASGTASGVLAASSLQEAVQEQSDLDVTVAADGDVLALGVEVLGLPVTVDVTPRVSGPETLAVDVEAVRTGLGVVSVDDLPAGVSGALTDLQIALDLPDGVALDSVAVADGGVRVAVTGTDVVATDLVAS